MTLSLCFCVLSLEGYAMEITLEEGDGKPSFVKKDPSKDKDADADADKIFEDLRNSMSNAEFLRLKKKAQALLQREKDAQKARSVFATVKT